MVGDQRPQPQAPGNPGLAGPSCEELSREVCYRARPPVQMLVTQVVNPVYLRLLRSPLHWLLSRWLVGLSFNGRRTGHRYELPIGYALISNAGGLVKAVAGGGSNGAAAGGSVLVATDARWRINFAQARSATVWLGGQRRTGTGTVINDPQRLPDLWAALLARRPVLGKLSGVAVDTTGAVVPQSLAAARAAGWDIIEIRLPDGVAARTTITVADTRADLSGFVVVVSGGTNGIGRAAALALAARGAQVTVLGRNEQRGHEVEQAAVPLPGDITFLQADVSRPPAIREAAAELLARHPSVDVLVHSAGGHLLTRTRTPDGIEVNFATNYLSKFLLTQLLLPALSRPNDTHGRVQARPREQDELHQEVRGRTARVVVVGSPVVAPRRTLMLDVAAGIRSAAPIRALVSSGTATAVWTVGLARRTADMGVTVTNVSPGLVRTGISRTWPAPARWLDRVQMAVVGLTAEEGAEPVLYLATAPELEGVTGQFYRRFRPARPPAGTFDRYLAERLWRLSEQLTSAAVPTAAAQ